MTPAAVAYLAALQEIQNAILNHHAGNISAERASRDICDTARHIPRLDREYHKEIGQ